MCLLARTPLAPPSGRWAVAPVSPWPRPQCTLRLHSTLTAQAAQRSTRCFYSMECVQCDSTQYTAAHSTQAAQRTSSTHCHDRARRSVLRQRAQRRPAAARAQHEASPPTRWWVGAGAQSTRLQRAVRNSVAHRAAQHSTLAWRGLLIPGNHFCAALNQQPPAHSRRSGSQYSTAHSSTAQRTAVQHSAQQHSSTAACSHPASLCGLTASCFTRQPAPTQCSTQHTAHSTQHTAHRLHTDCTQHTDCTSADCPRTAAQHSR